MVESVGSYPVPGLERRDEAARTPGPAQQPAQRASADEPPVELIDAAAEVSASGAEDHESAVPPVASTEDSRAPSVAAATKRIPESTRRLLTELFKAEITSVRRISRDQLR